MNRADRIACEQFGMCPACADLNPMETALVKHARILADAMYFARDYNFTTAVLIAAEKIEHERRVRGSF